MWIRAPPFLLAGPPLLSNSCQFGSKSHAKNTILRLSSHLKLNTKNRGVGQERPAESQTARHHAPLSASLELNQFLQTHWSSMTHFRLRAVTFSSWGWEMVNFWPRTCCFTFWALIRMCIGKNAASLKHHQKGKFSFWSETRFKRVLKDESQPVTKNCRLCSYSSIKFGQKLRWLFWLKWCSEPAH